LLPAPFSFTSPLRAQQTFCPWTVARCPLPCPLIRLSDLSSLSQSARNDICKRRAKRDLNQCTYVRDIARLATWIESNRRQLPRHVFVLDALPAHHRPLFELDHGRWWTTARALWRRLAPSVRLIESHDLLQGQGGTKVRDCFTTVMHSGVDPQHSCIDSSAYETYVSAVLTAVVEGIARRGHSHRASRHSSDADTVRAHSRSDRL